METATMGRTLVHATIENLYDLYEVQLGKRQPEQVRRIEIPDALVDTGSTMLMLPRRYVDQLGLQFFEKKLMHSPDADTMVDVYCLAQLTIQGRKCPIDVGVVRDACPTLIGQLPLERLDFVVDPVGRRLIGNPAHGGEFALECYGIRTG
jgi:predicted aspartyl protease